MQPHLQQPGTEQALRWKNTLKQIAIEGGAEFPGHQGVAQLIQQMGVNPNDNAAVTAGLAQAVGAPPEE
jgi:hypothetical protein